MDIKTQYSYMYLAPISWNKTPVFSIIIRIYFSALVYIYSNPVFSSRSIHALSDTGPHLWGPRRPQEIPSGELVYDTDSKLYSVASKIGDNYTYVMLYVLITFYMIDKVVFWNSFIAVLVNFISNVGVYNTIWYILFLVYNTINLIYFVFCCVQYSLISAYLNPVDRNSWIRLAELCQELGDKQQATLCYTKGRTL